MNIERLKQISFAEGAVEGFIEKQIAGLSEEQKAQGQHVTTMWQTLIAGLEELREENLVLRSRVETANAALLGV